MTEIPSNPPGLETKQIMFVIQKKRAGGQKGHDQNSIVNMQSGWSTGHIAKCIELAWWFISYIIVFLTSGFFNVTEPNLPNV